MFVSPPRFLCWRSARNQVEVWEEKRAMSVGFISVISGLIREPRVSPSPVCLVGEWLPKIKEHFQKVGTDEEIQFPPLFLQLSLREPVVCNQRWFQDRNIESWVSTLNFSKWKWRKLARICTTYLNLNIWEVEERGFELKSILDCRMTARMDSLGYRMIPHIREELQNNYKLYKII